MRTRFAPSPTGFLHVGGARTALFCWLEARSQGGEFLLRIEDTDRERSTEESVQAILDGMRWLGLEHDGEIVYQSQRQARYEEIIQRLLDDGKAYHCYCSKERLEALREQQMEAGEKPKYDGRCRNLDHPPADVAPVVRFRNPDTGTVVFDDRVRGTIETANAELDDLIIQRPDGSPTYNLSVVVDDLDSGITLVIRGDDHINNTPRQINIYSALGAEPPEFAHVPMILGEDGARLSKRHGAVSVMAYRDAGYLPEALLNYLVRLGWSHGDDEVFTRDQMIELFSIDEVNRKAASFDTGKLNWINQHWMRELPAETVGESLAWHLQQLDLDLDSGPPPAAVVPVHVDRAHTLVEMAEQARPYYSVVDRYDEKAAKKFLRPAARQVLEDCREAFSQIDDWQPEAIDEAVKKVMDFLDIGMGKVAQPLRVAVMGNSQSPSIDQTLWLVGRERTLERLTRAIAFVIARERRLEE